MAGGNGQRTSEQCYGILVMVMVGMCGGDQNLGFNSFVCWYCSYVRNLGSRLTSC